MPSCVIIDNLISQSVYYISFYFGSSSSTVYAQRNNLSTFKRAVCNKKQKCVKSTDNKVVYK